MLPTYEVLLLFRSVQGHLAEIKRLDLAPDAPKDRVYLWVWIAPASVTTLQFMGMQRSPREERTCEEARLWFNEDGAELQWRSGQTLALTRDDAQAMPPAKHLLVLNHLS